MMFAKQKQGSVIVPSSVIRPEPLLIFIDPENKKISLVNAITFKKATRPKQITRTLRNIMNSELRGEIGFYFEDERDSLTIVFTGIDVESEENVNRVVLCYAKLFSKLTISFPQYTYQEYGRYGIKIDSDVLIIIARPISEVREALKHEALTMVYPFLTIPDADGRYYISTVGMDYLYFPGLSIASEKKDLYIVYEPIEDEEGVKLVPLDVKELAKSLLEEIKSIISNRHIEIVDRAIGLITEIAERPYLLLKHLEDLKTIVTHLERRAARKKRPSPVGRTKTEEITFYGGEERISEENKVIGIIVRKLAEFIEALDVIKNMDERLNEVYVYRALAKFASAACIAFTGKIHTQKVRRLQKFGAGNALYLSAEEVREFLSGTSYVKAIFIEDPTGKKRIIVEPYEE